MLLLHAEYNNENQNTLPPNGRRIYEYIVDNPGCHVRKISRELDTDHWRHPVSSENIRKKRFDQITTSRICLECITLLLF